MLKAEMAPCFVMAMLLIPTPTVADVTSELARCELRRNVYIRFPTTRVSRIGQNGQPIYRNGPRISKRVCEGLVIGSPQNVPRP